MRPLLSLHLSFPPPPVSPHHPLKPLTAAHLTTHPSFSPLPHPTTHPGAFSLPQGGGRAGLKLPGGATGPTEVIKSVLDTDRTGAKEEIFVDIVEKLTAIFDASGHQKSSSIVGAIQVSGRRAGVCCLGPPRVWGAGWFWCRGWGWGWCISAVRRAILKPR